MKKILILGAGIYQLPLIMKAKELGFYTIVSSIEGDYPGFKIADKIYHCDTTNKDAILNIAVKEKIDAIVTTGTDVALISIGYVCDKMNIRGINYEQAVNLTDKSKMKEVLVNRDVPTSDFKIIYDIQGAEEACENIGYPVVFKATDKSGSRGICVVNNSQDIKSAFTYAINETNKNYIIIEKFVNGYEIGVDGFISTTIDDSIIIPHNKIVYNNGSTNVPIGHSFPMNCDTQLYGKIKDVTFKAAKAFNLNDCFVNLDLIIDKNEVYVIEIAARCGGTCIPELIECFSGIDYYKYIVLNAVKDIQMPKPLFHNPCMGMLIFSKQSGRLIDVKGKEMFDSNKIRLSLDYEKGNYVKKFHNGSDRVGSVIVDISDISKADEIKNQLLTYLEVIVE